MGYKVLITEDIDKEGKDYLKKFGYEIKLAESISEENLIKEVKDCDAILVRMAPITAKVIDAGLKLKIISKHGVGVDNIDVEEATKRGIRVTNSPDSNKNTVAEYTMGLIISLAKKFFLYDRELRKGNFHIRDSFSMDLEGKVLGIIGAGSIGNLVATKASKGFGMKVIEFKRHINGIKESEDIEFTDNLDYLLKNSHFISLHVPLTESTKGLIGERELSLMKPEAFLINTARGEVVNNKALVDALLNNKIAGAAIDVYEGEVPSKDNPVFKLENVIVTPHTAAHTVEAMKRMSLHPAIGIQEILSGKEPSWPVN
ncbi:hydroxyacid dehydrogenase [Clostridium pasteurianum]|uniref:Phosphoglycerate dehydrogenase-like oxidoreductase n=1 Tax=Clostridium pasteurianum BC1 TaxID=86416 RepID=R4KA02_CLOPA|nr:hydroxyacid dehydrogenase [Clostridium pasteurianum]AGK99408.1 phosphoglycerate dehydrogenase-like oxidoreductase [Clostridium pasteurianum BC1]